MHKTGKLPQDMKETDKLKNQKVRMDDRIQ
jgi:hypothetical protein